MSQSSNSLAPSQESSQQAGSSNVASVQSRRRRETSPNGTVIGSGGHRQSTAIHQGTARLMALMHQEQAALAAVYEESIRSLSRKLKTAQEQINYLTQVSVGGSDLLALRNDFQSKLEDAHRIIQDQKRIHTQLLDAVHRNGMELVSISETAGQKVDLRFNDLTREVISKFFHLPETNSSDPSLLSTSLHDDLSPLNFFAFLQGAAMQSQLPERDNSSNPQDDTDGAPDDAIMHPPSTDIHSESTNT